MSWLSRISLVQRGLIALMAIVAVVFGTIAIPQLKQQLLPSIDLPMVSVVAPYPGAAPDVVEKQVVEPLENAVKAVDGITGVTSTASEGSAAVVAQFEYGNGGDRLITDVQQAVNRVRATLPDGVDPQVLSGGTDDLPTVVLAATSPRDQQALADAVDRTVVPVLDDIDGVGRVTVTGVRERVVTVTPDAKKLARAGLSSASVVQALSAGGKQVPAGSFSEDGRSLTVQTGSEYGSLEQIEDLRLAPAPAPASAGAGARAGAPAAKPVRLGDVAEVKESDAKAASLTRTNGEPSLGISLTLDRDGSAVTVSEEVAAQLADLERSLGAGAELTVVSDQGPAVSKAVEGLTTEGMLGLVMAVVVILVFLASLRSTVVTAVSIPLSVLLTLIVLWTRDLSLNMLTLGALTIAVGRVVDDSIVVLENIKRHLGYGEERTAAILTAVREVAGAVTSSTLTTVAVFLPIGLVGGMVGELFGSFSITVTVALLASLLVSLTIVPVLSYWFLKAPRPADTAEAEALRREAEEKEARSLLQRAYLPVLEFATRRRVVSLLLAAAVFAGTIALVPLLKTNFFANGDQDAVSIRQELEPGTSLETTDAAAKKVEAMLEDLDGVAAYQANVGSAGMMAAFGGGSGTNQVSYSVRLEDSSRSQEMVEDLREGLEALEGTGTTTVSADGGFGGQDLSVVVKAPDAKTLRTASEAVREAVAGMDDVTDVTSDLSQSVPRVKVSAKPAEAARLGLTETAIGQAVAQAVDGTRAATAVLDDTQRDVLVRTQDAPRTVEELKDLKLATAAGEVRLEKVAKVAEVPGPVQLTRIDGARSATVTATPTGENVGAASTELQSVIAGLDLPEGATAEIGGVSSDQDEAFTNLFLAMLAAVAIVFLLLVGTFRSLVQPLILLVSIPFAATGAIGLLLVTGIPLGVPSLIGMLMLIGIVVTNAIVLIDLINQYRDQGLGIHEAVVEGGRHRLRPILMTALATIFALVPMAMGVTGGGGFIAQPLAVVVIGGLVSSTVLTLVLVPTLYTMVETRREKRHAKKEAARAKAGAGAGERERDPEPAGV
ncbi:MMPL family transporter [Streptomyces sp. SCUT-3]|uniref:efflux RND transporter permease subunit n=1 Tax=Streptomyces sp. SCUT-3 TaxID=2684469 RepID=UPI000CA74932|nr:efflux RND transporter permease subunit [Streptomyces sp. SCUT-3]PLW74559.1 hydrogenase expression protein [Streptomyces sp. DJ]QMV23765.1 MMPL family transporter [Streptomyces sp. SCUT-3]